MWLLTIRTSYQESIYIVQNEALSYIVGNIQLQNRIIPSRSPSEFQCYYCKLYGVVWLMARDDCNFLRESDLYEVCASNAACGAMYLSFHNLLYAVYQYQHQNVEWVQFANIWYTRILSYPNNYPLYNC